MSSAQPSLNEGCDSFERDHPTHGKNPKEFRPNHASAVRPLRAPRNWREAKRSARLSAEWDQVAETARSDKKARRHALAGQEAEVAWLEKVFCESDPLGLIALGAPADEYRSEAETITLCRREASFGDDVQRIVHEEFVYWFDQQIAGPPEKYSQIADVLWRRWDGTAVTSLIHEHVAKVVGPAPSTAELATALWADDVDVDSDGDPRYPWELTVALRPGEEQRVDIDGHPQGSFENVIIRATTLELLNRSIAYLTAAGAIEA